MTDDAVIRCPTCKGDRVVRGADGELETCKRCDALGIVPAPAFRIPLRRARPGTQEALDRRYGSRR